MKAKRKVKKQKVNYGRRVRNVIDGDGNLTTVAVRPHSGPKPRS
jgi:hypothetical protein